MSLRSVIALGLLLAASSGCTSNRARFDVRTDRDRDYVIWAKNEAERLLGLELKDEQIFTVEWRDGNAKSITGWCGELVEHNGDRYVKGAFISGGHITAYLCDGERFNGPAEKDPVVHEWAHAILASYGIWSPAEQHRIMQEKGFKFTPLR